MGRGNRASGCGHALEALNAVHPDDHWPRCRRFNRWQRGGMGRTRSRIMSYLWGRPLTWTKPTWARAKGRGARIRMLPGTDQGTPDVDITGNRRRRGGQGQKAIADRLSALEMSPERHRVIVPDMKSSALRECDRKGGYGADVGPDGLLSTPTFDDVAHKLTRRGAARFHALVMPLNPGKSAVFLGHRGRYPACDRAAGCARSPALNGADWVLSRVICGCRCDPRDIAGHGGRRSAERDSKPARSQDALTPYARVMSGRDIPAKFNPPKKFSVSQRPLWACLTLLTHDIKREEHP